MSSNAENGKGTGTGGDGVGPAADSVRDVVVRESEPTFRDSDAPPRDSKPSLLKPGTLVDNFQVARLVGRGGMGEVYLARDTLLGRKVALKVIKSDAVGDEHAVERFLLEARITARFNHPHIVTIHSVGVVDGVPYVALEYLEGGSSLRQRLEEDPPSVRESIRIGLAIVEALAEAHKHEVLHHDLKPENVLIPGDGRLRVVDFGLAQALANPDLAPQAPVQAKAHTPVCTPKPEPVLAAALEAEAMTDTQAAVVDDEGAGFTIVGTPLYMAPEQWYQDPSGPTTDMWALGVIFYEMLAGELPFNGTTIVGVCGAVCSEPHPRLTTPHPIPAELDELVERCLSKDPGRRPSAHEVAGVLRQLLIKTRSLDASQLSPFRGLLPFTERHADMFFGREAETAAFVERLRVEPVLPIVGPSGAGKSSFVQAGVVPRLRDQGRWIVLQLRPGAEPFQALALRLRRGEPDVFSATSDSLTASSHPGKFRGSTYPGLRTPSPDSGDAPPPWLAGTPDDEALLAESLLEAPGQLAVILQRLAEQEEARVLLFVDQLEELYALTGDLGSDEETRRLRRAFMEALCRAADDPLGPVRVIFTLRDDFMIRLAETEVARRVLGKITVLRSPDPDALREILTKPLDKAGYKYDDPELPEEMVAAVGGELACLPTLQFACSKLWDRREKTRHVVTRQAYDEMGGVEGALARHADDVLEGLPPADGRVARQLLLRLVTPEGTRRVMARARLLEGLGDQAPEVLGRLVDGRTVMVRKGRRRTDGGAAFELVHESLVTRWGQLARWIDESREEVAFLAEVGQAAELWHRRGRLDDEVWRGAPLQEAVSRAARCSALPRSVQLFLDAGQREENRRIGRKRLITVATIGGLTLASVVFIIVALAFATQGREAEAARERAELQRAQAQREGAQGAYERGDLVEARAKLRRALETHDDPLTRALWWRLSEDPLVYRAQFGFPIYALAVSPDGRTVATGSSNRSVYLLDTKTQAIEFLRGQESQVLGVAFSADGKLLASGTTSGEVGIWSLSSDTFKELHGHAERVWGVAFSPDGKLLATASYDETARIWDVETGKVLRVLKGHNGCVWAVAFGPDGRTLATGGCDGKVRLWDVARGSKLAELQGHDERIQDLEISPNGKLLASASRDRTVRLWNLPTGSHRAVLRGHGDRARSVSFSADGELLATSGDDGTIRLWQVSTLAEQRVLKAHSGWVWAVSFMGGDGASGPRLVSGSHDKTIRLWDLGAGGSDASAAGHSGRARGVAFSPDGHRLASSADDGTLRLWDVETGATDRVLRGPTGGAWGVSFSPDGELLACNGHGETVRLLEVDTGAIRGTLAGHVRWAADVDFSRDGTLLASAGRNHAVQLWDVASSEVHGSLSGHDGAVASVSFEPGGERIASASHDGTVRIWEVSSGLQHQLLRGHEGRVSSVRYSPDGAYLASGGADGNLRIWDVAALRGRSGAGAGSTAPDSVLRGGVLGRHDGGIYRVRFVPGAQRVATASADGTARVWDIASGDALELRGHLDEVNGLSVSFDGRLAATASDDGTVRVWDLATAQPRWRMPVMLTDPVEVYTHNGWHVLGEAAGTGRAPSGAWRLAVAERAAHGAVTADGDLLCFAAFDGSLELWDLSSDRRLFREPRAGLQQVIAVPPDGCLALAEGGRAWLYDRGGMARELARGASALAMADGELLVAGDRLLAFDTGGERRWDRGLDAGCTALARVGDRVIVGFREGTIEQLPDTGAGSDDARRPRCADVPPSAVTRLMAGPPGTIVAGFENGVVGIWSLDNGRPLYQTRLHGPVAHLAIEGHRLHVGSELGRHMDIDLDIFYLDHCQVLRDVWAAVPVVWEGGMAVDRSPAADHRCAPAAAPEL